MVRYVYAGAAVHVPAPPEQVFALITDWPRHREWMFMTDARQVGVALLRHSLHNLSALLAPGTQAPRLNP
ncbi:SRPBCC family protein [Nonomuraea sp. NPDC051941]|uniref:SRPBCC family protein n=1 Tax=Nonomuraea sp. NPDC051941 TaxID=3364373 RepID=UPI0037C90338